MERGDEVRWWAMRRAQSTRPATYRCPLCGQALHAMSDHVLIAPEGDAGRRRHAHTDCVLAAREAGRLPLREEWEAATGAASGAGRWRFWRRKL